MGGRFFSVLSSSCKLLAEDPKTSLVGISGYNEWVQFCHMGYCLGFKQCNERSSVQEELENEAMKKQKKQILAICITSAIY